MARLISYIHHTCDHRQYCQVALSIGSKKFRTRNIWVTTRAWISEKIFNVQIKLSVRGYICVANWSWIIVLTRIATQEVANNLKNWECAASGRKYWKKKTTKMEYFPLQDDQEPRAVSLFFYDLDWRPTFIKLLLPRVCRKPSRKVGMPRHTRENVSIPGNVSDRQHARRDPDELHNDSRNLATLLAIHRKKELRKVREKSHRSQHLYFVLK